MTISEVIHELEVYRVYFGDFKLSSITLEPAPGEESRFGGEGNLILCKGAWTQEIKRNVS